MTAINTALENITLGEPQAFQNLEITPLLARGRWRHRISAQLETLAGKSARRVVLG